MQRFGLALAIVAAPLVGCSGDAPNIRPTPSAAKDPGAGAAGTAATAETSAPMFGNAGSTGGAAAGAPAVPPAGTGGADDGQCGVVTQMAQNMLQPVDVILGVDTTGSMGEEIGFTEQNMNAFSEQITSAGIDVRVVLVSSPKDGMPLIPVHLDGVCIAAPLGSGNCPADSNPPRYVHIPQPHTDGDMLQNYIDTYPMYKEYLREDSFKTFVSISDGDIASNPVFAQPIGSAETFIAAVDALEPNSPMWRNWRYSAIYSFSLCGIGNDIGATHAELVSRTQGVGGDLCLQDFRPVFDDLARQVMEVVNLACEWDIPPPPRGETFDPGKTNVQLTLEGTAEPLGNAATAADCGTRDGWHYDDDAAPRRVVACPFTCTRIQAALDARVDLLFGCETVVLPPVE
jgi:hypothetical protein